MARPNKCSNPIKLRHNHKSALSRLSITCLSLCKKCFPEVEWNSELKVCNLCRLKIWRLTHGLGAGKSFKPNKWANQLPAGNKKTDKDSMSVVVRVEKLEAVQEHARNLSEKTAGTKENMEDAFWEPAGVGKYRKSGTLNAMEDGIMSCGGDIGGSSSSRNGFELSLEHRDKERLGWHEVPKVVLDGAGTGTPGILKTPSSYRGPSKTVHFADVEAEFLIFSNAKIDGDPKPLIISPNCIQQAPFEVQKVSPPASPVFFEEDLEGIDVDPREENFMFKVMGLIPCTKILTEDAQMLRPARDQTTESDSMEEALKTYEKALEAFLMNEGE